MGHEGYSADLANPSGPRCGCSFEGHMTERYEEILDMIEAYGFERILEDAGMKQADVLSILDELGFVDLEIYEDE